MQPVSPDTTGVGGARPRHTPTHTHTHTHTTHPSAAKTRGTDPPAAMPDAALCVVTAVIHIYLLGQSAATGGLKVFVPDTLQVLIGEDAIFNCTFVPSQYSAPDLIIHWLKQINSETELTVYSFYHDQEQQGMVEAEFVNRTQRLQASASGGSCALVLRDVRITDAGIYRAYIKTDPKYGQATTVLQVAAPYSLPHIRLHTVCARNNTAVYHLTCTVSRGYPMAFLHWHTDLAEDWTTQALTSSTTSADGLISINSRLNITIKSSKTFICSVYNPLLHRELNVTKVLPVTPCVRSSSVGIVVTLSVLGALLLLAAVFTVRFRRRVNLLGNGDEISNRDCIRT
ncbi:CD276 antigen homolog isoform X2 [Heterodontus francisci]|uniref:CD276 antigen homolog isoform X2 n=1 Tax=Heterodontus francisci TaxID=7792 RepID=UPI00355AEA93